MSDIQTLSDGLTAAVEAASASILTVDARRKFPASGIAYADDLVLTADHVVTREEDIRIGLPDGNSAPATLAGRDPGSDLALLRLNEKVLTPAKTNPNPKVGQLVLDGGIANGVQVVPKAWIDECLTEHHKDTVAPGVGYGYFFWHTHIETPNNTRHSCWFMAGNGGNVVAIFPELRGVAVITRTDFNSGATARETLEILGKYVGVVLEGGKK